MAEELSLIAAFIGGLISFFSPCVVPLIPAYLSHLSGVSLAELKAKRNKTLQRKVFVNSIFFVLGFSVIFIVLGTLIGTIGAEFRGLLGQVGGTIIIIFGLQTMGLINIGALNRSLKIQVKTDKGTYLSSAFIGAAFGVGWSPCVGPILAAILILAGTSGSAGSAALLLTAYSLGLSIPFLLTGLFTAKASNLIQKNSKYLYYVNIVAGILLIILGILVFTDRFQQAISLIL